jgi:hypothetical protein
MPALDVHQCGGEAQPFYICEQQRCWNEYGTMKDLWGSLKGLRKSTYAPPSLGGGGLMCNVYARAPCATQHTTCCPWGLPNRVYHSNGTEQQLEVKDCLRGMWKQDVNYCTWLTIQHAVCSEHAHAIFALPQLKITARHGNKTYNLNINLWF